MATCAILIATIPGREEMLQAALDSVKAQTRQPDQIHVERDPFRTGAASTRNRGLKHITTDYVFLLDDDDVLLPCHVEALMEVVEMDDTLDVVYPVPEFVGHSPRSIRLLLNGRWVPPWGIPWTEQHRQHMIARNNFIPVTNVVKTASMRRVGGFPEPGDSDFRLSHAEDWLLWRRMALKGMRFAHLPLRTWRWVKGTHHTEGRGKG